MGKDQLRAVWSLGFVGGLAIALAPAAVWAQLVPDGSLGVESSVIQKINELSDRIDGGAARGANLFHSFQEFNVGQGRSVYFANPAQIQNILSRVTGGNASNILGRLGVLGSANLFLINPNGIVFGPNSSLDIQGSFFATTADGIRLGDKGFFSATEPGKSDLLSVSPGALFFNQAANQAGNIINRGNLTVGGDLTLVAGSLDLQGQLLSGGNLTLQAWDGVKIRDTVESPFVAAAAGDLLIQGNNIDIFTLNNPQSGLVSYGNLTLKSPNPVIGDAHYWSGGNFRIETLDNNLGELQSIKDPIIRTGGDVLIGAYQGASLHIIAGGSVTIPDYILITGADPEFGLQEAITLSNGQEILIDGKNNPTLDIRAGVKPEFIGTPIFKESGDDFFGGRDLDSVTPTSANISLGAIIFSTNLSGGTRIRGDVLLTNQYQPNLNLGGNINLEASLYPISSEAIQTGTLDNGGRVTIDSMSNINIKGNIDSESLNGKGGEIFLKSLGNISIGDDSLTQEAIISASSNQEGGEVIFQSSGDVSINNAIIAATGKEGNINIIGNNVNINNSIISTGIFQLSGLQNEQKTGNIKIIATDSIILDNQSTITDGIVGFFNVEQENNVDSQVGNNIDIETRYLELNNSIISTTSSGIGSAGNIKIKATEEIKLESSSSFNRSLISSGVSGFGSDFVAGNAGNIVVETKILELNNSSAINSTQNGLGNAGNININATESIKSNGFFGGITTGLGKNGIGKSGDIQIVTKNLELVDQSQISATTFGQGNGGNINILADNIRLDNFSFITNSPSDISSQLSGIRQKGDTGNIEIFAQSIEVMNLSQIASNTLGAGNAGDIKLTAEDNIILGLGSSINSQVSPSFSTEVIGNGGNIWIKTPQLSVQDISGIFSDAQGTRGNAGNIEITTEELALKGASRISSFTNSNQSKPGSIIISNGLTPTQLITLEESRITAEIGQNATLNPDIISNIEEININSNNINLSQNSTIRTLTKGEINASNIIISTATINLNQSSKIETSTNSNATAGNIIINSQESVNITNTNSGLFAQTQNIGNAGNITINTPKFTLSDGAGIEAFTSGEGTAGNITINAPNSIILNSDTKLIVETSDAGTAGNININTPLLTIGENAQLSATATSTSTSTSAGNINLNINQLNISGELGIFAETNSTPTAGSLTIQPYENNPNLNIHFTENGFISARTTNIGDGGSISLTAPENIDISGLGSITAETSGEGNAGNINITTENLTIRDGVEIRANTSSVGDSGNIVLSILNLNLDSATIEALTTNQGNPGSILISNGENQANQVNVANDSKISTEINGEGNPETAQPANITINSENLSLTSSQITASTTSNRDAGNINLTGNNLNLDNGKISAITSNGGKGGNIEIPNADNLNLINNSEISASTSGEGNAGSLDLNVNQMVNIDSGSTMKVETSNSGNAGAIKTNSPTITIGQDAELSARTSNLGKAGNVTLETNQLNISGELGIFAETEGEGKGGNLMINPLENNPNLEINFTNEGNISASTLASGDGGDININAPKNISISGDGIISVKTEGSGEAGTINLNTQNLNLTNGIEINASTESIGNSGNINLNANNINIDNATIQALTTNQGNPGSILISNGENQANQVNITNNSTISTEIRGEGDRSIAQPANITIDSENLSLTSSQITASTTSNRDAGNINLNNNQINLDNGRIIAITSGSGKGGEISIPNTQTLNLINNSGIIALTSGAGEAGNLNFNISESVTIDSGSFFNVETEAGGKAGQIIITSPVLTVGDNAELSARSQANATGEAGNITLTTNQLDISGELGIFAETESIANAGNLIINPLNNNPNLIINFFNKGKISASTLGDGDGGDINITAPEIVNISGNGSIQVEANSSGDAGEIFINANNQINLSNGVNISALTSGSGKAGNINLTSENLNLTEGVTITASTTGDGDAGSINLSANNLNFNQTEINAVTNSTGNAGNILINYQQENANNLTLTNSTISTEIQANGIANQPSNITIKTDNLNSENSTITASTSGKGNAGNIAIVDTENINLNNSNIIATTSGEGNTGEIELTANNILRLSDSQVSSSVEENAIGNSQQITLNTPNLSLNQSNILAETAGQGNAGSIIAPNANTITLDNSTISTAIAPTGQATQPSNIILNTQQLTLDNNSRITASTEGKGDAGSITVPNAQQITLNQSEITASTSGEGDTGVIDLKATGNLNLANSQINSSVEQGAVGNSRQITLDTPNLSLNSSQINATTAEQGNAGSIIAPNANVITLDNSTISTVIAPTGQATQPSNIILNTQQLTLDNNSRITASTEGKGDAGSITVPNAQQITLNQSEITASTSGEGDTGVIDLKATGNLNLANSQINSSVEQGAVGNSRQITLDTPNLSLNSSQINATTAGQGNAGSIIAPNANTITLDNSTISTAIAPTGQATQPSNITLNTQELTLDNNSQINATTAGKGDAGSITVPNAQQITLNQSEITASTSGEGDTGVIDLKATGNLNLANSQINSSVEQGAVGNSRQITLDTPNLNLNNSQINATTAGQGNAGSIIAPNANSITLDNSIISTAIAPTGQATQPSNITLNTQQLTLDNNSRITASTSGKGDTGVIDLKATGNLNLTNSQISSSVEQGAVGNSRQITLNTPNLNLNNSQINATTAGQGNAGSIIAPNANTITLDNSTISTAIAPTGQATQPSNIILNTQQLTLDNNSRITASTEGKGNAGNITVPNAQTISLDNNSQINASTSGEGNAGDIALKTQTVTLNNSSAITTTVNPNAIGRGGNITLQTTGNFLTLNNQSQISSLSQGQGNAGNILINSAGNVTLTNSDISTSAEQASGGAITITASNLRLNGDSNLRTNVASGAGGGGDITLTAGSILAFGDSDILAFARDGKGGNITINTPIFFAEGFQPIPQDPNSLNGNNRVDINASGAVSGIITLPDLSFIPNSLIDLPENLIDTDNLIANSCVVPNRQKAGTFVITGSGGLPPRPGDASMSSYSTGTVRAVSDKPASSRSWQPGNPIIEPQGLYRLSNGQLVLSRECP